MKSRHEDAVTFVTFVTNGDELITPDRPFLVAVLGGSMRVSVEGDLVPVRAGRGIWLPSGEEIEAATDSEVAVLEVEEIFRVPTLFLVSGLVREALLRLRDPLGHVLRGALMRVLREELALSSVALGSVWPSGPGLEEVAEQLLSGEAAAREVADRAGMSGRTLDRWFEREVGMSAGTWRRSARLRRAARLLLGGLTVEEAAYRSGYCDRYAFSRGFEAEFWMSPIRFRREFGAGL